MAGPECPICSKHRGGGPLTGPVVYADELVLVTHRAGGALGYAFIETRRHVASLDQLTDREAGVVGAVRTRLTRALRDELQVDSVHAMVAGLAVPHFHEHVFVRHRGTPEQLPWWQQWDGAPCGDTDALARRLSLHLADGRAL
ncbi:MAG TPA: HIT domain-containing protein [Propionibacteriaceae bacterium]